MRNRHRWMLLAAPVFALSPTPRGDSSAALMRGCTAGIWGDVNADASVNIVDAQQVARFSVGLTVANPTTVQLFGDVTADDAVNIVDAQQIARFSVGLTHAPRVNQPAPANPVVATIQLTPTNPTTQVDGTVDLTAVPRDAGGASLAACATVAFTTLDPTIAIVSATGTVKGTRFGTTGIVASSGGTSAGATVAVQVAAASGPLRVSTVNPRYFVNGSGVPVYLAGSHTWADFQDVGVGFPPPAFDYAAYLDFLVARGHNLTKFWTFENERWSQDLPSDDFWSTPVPYLRTGPALALDGRPRFDLTQFNSVFFDRLRQRIIAAGQRGIYVSIMFFEGESLEPDLNKSAKNPWEGHPFNRNNNINGIDGDPDNDNQGLETHRLRVPAITALQQAYIRRLVDAVNDLDNVLYEISLEDRAGAEVWQNQMIQYVRQYEATKPRQHPIGMTFLFPGGQNSDLFASAADWISPNGDVADTPVADGSKLILQDSDHLCGTCTDLMWPWRNFTRGASTAFMDPYDGALPYNNDPNTLGDPAWQATRSNLGYVLAFSRRVNLLAMRPRGDLASSGYCLANPSGSGAEYIVLVPGGGGVSVDLTGASGTLAVEWFLPGTGQTIPGGSTTGGGSRAFTAPGGSDAVLYIRK